MAVIPVRVSKPGRSLLSMKVNTDTDEYKFIPTIQGLQVMGSVSSDPLKAHRILM